ncbi:hypothetical protein TWF730_006589 [Orbilia blumenaviensis]|uniref:Uncharacterized protein n=1 Tax=Orbilia blumenaviensis TaxID=1796055 RepID=A0AAV9VH23_9PEZI
MRLLQLSTILALGAGSLAILIPPSDSLNTDIYKVKPIPAKAERPKVDTHGLTPEQYAVSQIRQTLEIPCESCPFPKKGEKDAFDNTPNNLRLTLSLDAVQRDIIKLNDAPMFPVIYAAKGKMPFHVIQQSLKDGREVSVPIDIDLFIETETSGLSRLRLHVLAVSGFKTMATMEILEFPVFQNEKGEVFIGEVGVRPPTAAEASSVMCKDNLLCRWKAYIYDSINSMAQRIKGSPRPKCKGKKVERPAHAVATELPPPHHGHHGSHKSHKQTEKAQEKDVKEHPHWKWFNWVGLVIRLILACLVIAAITITIGLFFTLIVSTAVHVAVVSWLFIKGRTCKRRQAVPEDDEEQGLMSKEEEARLETEEYRDDLPVYTENQQK